MEIGMALSPNIGIDIAHFQTNPLMMCPKKLLCPIRILLSDKSDEYTQKKNYAGISSLFIGKSSVEMDHFIPIINSWNFIIFLQVIPFVQLLEGNAKIKEIQF